jgi:putative two-component system response regulator
MRILVAEDNKVNRLTLLGFLKELGHNPVGAEDGYSAYQLWEKERFKLVITDLNMPNMNGLELIKRIRTHEFSAETYIIVLTAYNDEIHIDQSFDGGADDFLGKPYNQADLKQRINIAERILSLQQKNLVIFALSRLAQLKDKDTGNHLNRVGAYSKVIAKGLEKYPKYKGFINRRYIEDLYMSCPLHDIGKVGIDDAILKKPGTYTEEEHDLMKQHVEIGYETVLSIKNQFPELTFLEMGLHIIRSHHEKYDGSGYPDGLKGTNIPLSARIVSLADYYDALVSERIYKSALSHIDAIEQISKLRGIHFDPDIVDVFLASKDDFDRIRKEGQ